MERKEEIERIKEQGLPPQKKEIQMEAIDTLAAYGKDGINPIMDIVNATAWDEVKSHGFQKIREINEKFKA